ncbi:MAG: hypothetical protein ABR577_20005 [Pyrinomonadaceae bacterium]|nr:hypothetical protein [Acidobacteriota bacterium]
MSLPRFVLVATALFLHLCLPVHAALNTLGGTGGQARKPNFSTPEQLQEDINASPCKGNSERLKAFG